MLAHTRGRGGGWCNAVGARHVEGGGGGTHKAGGPRGVQEIWSTQGPRHKGTQNWANNPQEHGHIVGSTVGKMVQE